MNIVSLFDRLTSIERWNLIPHTGCWTEAENIAYNALVAYGLCTKHSDIFSHADRNSIITFILLKNSTGQFHRISQGRLLNSSWKK